MEISWLPSEEILHDNGKVVEWKDLTERKKNKLGEFQIKKGDLYLQHDSGDRKKAGAFYTPEYVVRKIVADAIDPLIQTEKAESIFDLRILDPAMGSGHFLLGVVEYLEEKYFEKASAADSNSEGIDPTEVQWRILRECIYGVDCNPLAVELAKFSLWMFSARPGKKLLTFKNQLKRGNSLLDPDFSAIDSPDTNGSLVPFDWKKEYPEIFSKKQNGFSAIVGNPPYITYSLGKGREKYTSKEVEYIAKNYPNSSEYKINSFAVFYERALQLTRDQGTCAFIVPGTILINDALSRIRTFLLEKHSVYRIISLNYRVFDEAEMGDCAILFVRNGGVPAAIDLVQYSSANWEVPAQCGNIPQKTALNAEGSKIYVNPGVYKLLAIGNRKSCIRLGEVASFYNGIKTGDNKKFLSEKRSTPKHVEVVRGRDFDRFRQPNPQLFVLFDPKLLWSNTDEKRLSVKTKVFIRQTGDRITATLDENGRFCMDTVHMIYQSTVDLKYLVGILNSKFFSYYHSAIVPENGKAFAEVKIANIEKIPIPRIDPANQTQGRKINTLVKVVGDLLDLNRKPKDRDQNLKKIAALESQLNEIVFDLYEVSDEEIKLVEEYWSGVAATTQSEAA